MLKKKQQIGR